MQSNPVDNNERLVFPCIWVLDRAVSLAISGLMHTWTGSHSSWGLSGAAICNWNHVGLCFFCCFSVSPFLIFLLFSLYPPFLSLFSPLLPQCDLCQDVPEWGLIAGLRGLLAILCLGTSWSHWRPVDIRRLGTHLPLSSMPLVKDHFGLEGRRPKQSSYPRCILLFLV